MLFVMEWRLSEADFDDGGNCGGCFYFHEESSFLNKRVVMQIISKDL